MTLPPIREWWPHLTDEARQEVRERSDGRLGESVREEIREITGAVVGMRETLDPADLEYARKYDPGD